VKGGEKVVDTFHITFSTDGEKNRNLLVRDAKKGLNVEDFLVHVGKIISSGLLNNADMEVTGIKKGELVTITRERYV
jgi:hypothetical protein